MTGDWLRMVKIAGVLALGVAVTGCGSGRSAVAKAIGVSKNAPNAFNVVPRKPLALPQDLASLPAPDPGAPSPLEPKPTEEARAALLGADPAATGGQSTGESALARAAGADEADPEVRNALYDESLKREPQYGLTTLFGYRVPDGTEKDRLEARDEARRLRPTGATVPNAPPPPEETPSNELF